MKDQSKSDDDNEGFLQVAIQKRKVVAADTPAPKKANKAQPTAEPHVSILPHATL